MDPMQASGFRPCRRDRAVSPVPRTQCRCQCHVSKLIHNSKGT